MLFYNFIHLSLLKIIFSIGKPGQLAAETNSMWMDSDDPDFVPTSADENDDYNPCKMHIYY